MSRLRMLLAGVLPSTLVGGLLFSTAFGQPAPPPPPPAVPAVPAVPAAPAPPAPPARHVHSHSHSHDRVVVTVNGQRIEVDNIRAMIDAQLAAATAQLANPNLPPKVRAKLEKRLEKVRARVARRLDSLDTSDLEKMSHQLDQLGNEISADMDGFGDEMEQWGRQVGEQIEAEVRANLQRNNQFNWGGGGSHDDADADRDHDHDHDHDNDGAESGEAGDNDAPAVDEVAPVAPAAGDEHDFRVAIGNLGDLALKPGQREQIQRIRADSDRHVQAVRADLDRMSGELRAHLADPNVDRDTVAHEIEAISEKEAEIRKARILAWVDARRVLDDSQRKRVEDVVRAHRHP